MQNASVSTSHAPTMSNSQLSTSISTSSLRPSAHAQSSSAPVPPEIETTISRLTAYRNVRGVLILARSGGIIQSSGSTFEGEAGRKYGGVVRRMVESVRSGVAEVDEGDDVKFMRIRTRRHELIITPDERYILVVLQDPQ